MLATMKALVTTRKETAAMREAERQWLDKRRVIEDQIGLMYQHLGHTSNEVDALSSPDTLCNEDTDDCPIVPEKNEQILLILRGCSLTERGPSKGTGSGGSSGRHRVFGSGAKKPTKICNGGTFVVTDQRAVYNGSLWSREFRWDKLLSHDLAEAPFGYLCELPVADQQNTSGICTDQSSTLAHRLISRVAFGVAMHHGRSDERLEEMRHQAAKAEEELAQLKDALKSLPDPALALP